MKSKYDKQRLFEVVGKLDNTFKSKLNEDVGESTKKRAFTLASTDNEPVYFDLDRYDNNKALAVELMSLDGESWAMISTNLPESADLPTDEFFLKNWSENEEIANELVRNGIIIPTGKQASMGAKSYKINPKYSPSWENLLGKRENSELSEENATLNETASYSPIHKYVMFAYNYPPDFIEKAWADRPEAIEHIKGKFSMYYSKHGAQGVMNEFYINLDDSNQQILERWIINNYTV